ncbi:GntR family transcriptional regulator, partial [Isoptericola sp. S6320L]
MSDIVVTLGAPVPVYEQIRSQVAAAVAVGTLRPGARLPASRDLARDLGIAVGTVQRAYRELEASGVVISRRRTGTVVA